MKRRAIGPVLVLMLLAALTCGCMLNEGDEADDKPLAVTVDTKDSYQFLFGDYLTAAYPALKVELIETNPGYQHFLSVEDYVKLIREKKPDLILDLNESRYEALADAGLISDLSAKLADSGMKEDDFYDGMIEGMKRLGGGKLLAISPDFSPSALYYNKTLFEKYGVEPPHSGMTLEEVFELAGRFTSAGGRKDGIVGLHQPYSNTPYDMLEQFGQNEGIRSVSYSSGQMTMNTPLWRHIVETTANLYMLGVFSGGEVKGKMRDGVLYYDMEASQQANLFEAGKAAMTIGRYGVVYKAGNDAVGHVGPPVSSSDGTQSGNIYMFHYMAIGSQASNADAAWDAIGFMVSDHMAKVLSKLSGDNSTGYDVPSSRTYLNYVQDPVLEELYDLKPIYQPADSKMAAYDAMTFNSQLKEMVNKEMAALIAGSQSVDTTLAHIDREGNKLLNAAALAGSAEGGDETK